MEHNYELYVSSLSTFANSVPACVTSSSNGNTNLQFNCSVYDLSAGIFYWKARVTKNIYQNSTKVWSYTKDSSSSIFSVCINTPPSVPQLVFPPDGTVFGRCNITTRFQWKAFLTSNFGIYCSGTNVPSIQIFIGLDPVNPNDIVLDEISFASETDPVSLIENFVSNGTYYWYVLASGSIMSTRSEIRMFVVPDVNVTACSGNGQCTTAGLCSCNNGFNGSECQFAIPTQPPIPTSQTSNLNSSAKPFPTGAIVGIVCALALLLVLALLSFIFVKRKFATQPPQKRPPPNFALLAFTPPEGYPPLEVTKLVPWYSFEQLFVSNGFPFAKAMMDASQATEIDDVAKCLVYVIESRSKGFFPFFFFFFFFFFLSFFFPLSPLFLSS